MGPEGVTECSGGQGSAGNRDESQGRFTSSKGHF